MSTIQRSLLIFSTLALLLAAAEARLGETKVEIEKRYGESVKSQNTSAVVSDLFSHLDLKSSDALPRMECSAYVKENWIVVVIYLDGKSVCETYFKLDSFEIKQDELIQLLKANAVDKQWRRIVRENEDDQYNLKWSLIGTHVESQKKEYATAILGGRSLTLTMSAITEYINEVRESTTKREAERKTKALKDF